MRLKWQQIALGVIFAENAMLGISQKIEFTSWSLWGDLFIVVTPHSYADGICIFLFISLTPRFS